MNSNPNERTEPNADSVMTDTHLIKPSGDRMAVDKVDFRGRLGKINAPKTESVRAVFEAVANAFDATKNLGGAGEIVVKILLNESLLTQGETEKEYRATLASECQ